MADLGSTPRPFIREPIEAAWMVPMGGMFGALARAQYGALARLRWRMFSNSLRSGTGAFELGARTVSFILYAVIGIAIGAGLGTGAYFLVSESSWRFVPILFWVLAFIWQMIPIMLASFQEQFDLSILLRFPLRFGSYMLLYLFFGLIDVSTILGGLCCVGIWIGVLAARPGLLVWTTLALAGFAAFNILLVRAVFAWIDRWLAQRKTREILGALFMVAILFLQLLNPAIYHRRNSNQGHRQQQAKQIRAVKARYAPLMQRADAIQKWLPPGLAAQALQQAAEWRQAPGQALAAGGGSLGLLGVYSLLAAAVLGVRLKAEYRGESLGVAPKRDKASVGIGQIAATGMLSMKAVAGEDSGPSLAGSIAAVIEKEIRALMRTLPLLYSMGAPLVLVLVFSSAFINGGGSQQSTFRLALPLCMVYAQLGFTQIIYNSLGAEGPGIQLYFLSPTPIRTVLLAKNLFHAVLFLLVALTAGVLSCLRLGVPDAAVIASTVAWLFFSLPANLAAGDVFSLRMAYRVNPGRIARQRGSQANALLSLLVQLGMLLVGAAVFAIAWSMGRMWLAVPMFLFLSAGAVFAWLRVLSNADAMANRRRDELITTLMKAA